MPSTFIQQLALNRVLVFDGAMGTSLHKVDLDLTRDYCGCENCVDILAKTRPDVVQKIHESFLEVGADAVETDSFGGARHVLAEFDLQAQCFELNKCAAEVARAACDKHSTKDKPRFAAGSMGPGTKLITLNQIDWDKMFESYREQARGLIAGGVDVLIIETCQDLLQTKCAINAAMAAIDEKGKTPQDIPIMVSVTIETTGTMLLGTEIAAAATALAGYPILSLGLNCATGPTEMSEHIHYLGKHWRRSSNSDFRFVSCLPNAGLPILHEGRTEYPLKPGPFVEAMLKFIKNDGVRIVGGCCGTTPEHIKQLAQAVDQINQGRRTTNDSPSTTPPGGRGRGGLRSASDQQRPDDPAPGAGATSVPTNSSSPSHPITPSPHQPAKPGITSLYSVQDYRQDTSILIIGERMNASGSRAFKKLLEAEDFDGIVSLAREQVRHDGAHVLDLNVDYAGRDNALDAAEVVRRVVRQVNSPLMLDSTQLATLEAGLKCAPGKCIINSANFEDGEHKFDQICHLAKKYGAALVIGSIDEDKEASMARTADRKLAIAQRAHARATQVHGLAEEDLLFDPLVLPISTGMESDRKSALETIEGVRRISKSLPNSQTTVGLSNVSFGLKPAARVVLNSVFLHELQQAGLTSAILHFSKILPKNKIPDDQWAAALELIYDKRSPSAPAEGVAESARPGVVRDPLQVFIELFKDIEGPGAAKKEKKQLSLEEQLRAHIIDGEKEGLVSTLTAALQHYEPLDIINDHLLDGMKTVGELFGSGQMQLPFVLQSAEVMKMAVDHLKPLMARSTHAQSKGKIVLATVKGDVHDIGKNLVDIILTNNGYSVINLGIKQPIAEIIKAWRTEKADAIGMSGLLVKSVMVMEDNLKELNELGITAPVVLGGAALTRHYCESHLRSTYKGNCIYGKDAFDGLRIMDFVTGGKTDELMREADTRQAKRSAAEDQIVKTRIEKLAAANSSSPSSASSAPSAPSAFKIRSDVSTTNPVPTPPFLGSRVIADLSLDDIYPFINPVALFRGQWQVKKGALSDADYDAMVEDKILPIFEALKAQCRDEKILQPKVVYGWFPCNSDGDDLIIWDPAKVGSGKSEVGIGNAAAPHARSDTSAFPLPTSDFVLDRLRFPRQPDKRRLCISDFFRPVSSGQLDYIGMHCVTMGPAASEAAQKLFQANRYTDYLYLHGLGVETAEALAEFWHKRMRQELSIANDDAPRIKDLFTQHYRGSRYSFGYPACPDMSHQANLFRLLQPERIGCTLTENWQIDPEQSTSAIIVHHPEAKYFNV